MPKLLRIVQLDDSDRRVYARPAEPGEWAVPGTFSFWDIDPEMLDAAARQAFAHGFLGIQSSGRGTLVQIATIDKTELDLATRCLASHLVEQHGAPDVEAALPAAREEIAFAQSLCEHPLGTLLGIERSVRGLDIVEEFKSIETPSAMEHEGVRLWRPGEDAV